MGRRLLSPERDGRGEGTFRSLAVRAVGPSGAPAAGVQLALHLRGFARAGLGLLGSVRGGRTDGEGRFEFPLVGPGAYELVARTPDLGMPVQPVSVGPGEAVELELVLTEGAPIEGTVRGADGRPTAGAQVFVRDADGRVLWPADGAPSDRDGAFRTDSLAPGSYSVWAVGEGTASAVRGPIDVRAGVPAAVDLELAPATRLEVAVSVDGAPVGDARLQVLDTAGHAWHGVLIEHLLMLPDAPGEPPLARHRIGPLPPGRYRVTAELPDGRRSETVALELAGELERTLVISF